MICKKCSTDYDESYSFCPNCGSMNETRFFTDNNGNNSSNEAVNRQYDAPIYYEQTELQPEKENDTPAVEKQEPQVKEKPAVRRKQGAAERKMPITATEKKAMALILVLLLVVGSLTSFLTVIRVKTDAFKNESKQQKVVALSKLSTEEETALEQELALYFSALQTEFDSEICDAEAFVERINPADSGNLYSRLNGSNDTLQTVADPAMRFCNEYEEYSYYKIEKAKIDGIFERFGLSSYDCVNTENCYFYDGFYYFNNIQSKTTPVVFADVTKTKKVSDGSFYAECYFYTQKGSETVKSKNYYVSVGKAVDASTGAYSFVINKASKTPLFTDTGVPVEINGSAEYVLETKVIEGRNNEGTLFCKYTVEYPVFSGNSVGINVINQVFSGIVSAYELKASSAQKDYEDFVSKGGDVSQLPYEETIVTRITYSDEKKISCVEKLATRSPEIPVKQEETTTADENRSFGYEPERDNIPQQPEQEPVKLFTRSVEAYTFDRATGDFISKDSIVGKDYMLISEILYRIYNSYEYESVITEAEQQSTTEADSEIDNEDYYQQDYYDSYYDGYYDSYETQTDENGIPEDSDGLGTAIYESACGYTKDGFAFYYVDENGFVSTVTLPLQLLERINAS